MVGGMTGFVVDPLCFPFATPSIVVKRTVARDAEKVESLPSEWWSRSTVCVCGWVEERRIGRNICRCLCVRACERRPQRARQDSFVRHLSSESGGVTTKHKDGLNGFACCHRKTPLPTNHYLYPISPTALLAPRTEYGALGA